MKTIRLCDIKCGETAKIFSLTGLGKSERRLSDLGFVSGGKVTCMLRSPLGDPTAYLVRGSLIALRREHSEKILVEVI